MDAHPELKDSQLSALDWNKLRDAIIAIERWYQENYQEYLANNTVRLNNNPYNKREIETVINNNRELVNDIRNVLSESQIAAANDLQNQYVETRQRSDIKGNVEKSETLLQRTISSQGILANVGGYFSLTEGKLNINTVSAAQNIILMY